MVEIRDATPADAEAIAAINAAGWRAAYRGIIEPDRLAGIPVAAWAREIARNLEALPPGAFSLVAEAEGVLAGSCFVTVPARDGDLGPEIGELVAIYVDPPRWRTGIGTALLGEAIPRAADQGLAALSLWTLTENAPAQAFYERHGFRPDGSEQIRPVARAPAIRMRRPVP
jgi:GNAT superfamily N-acetyltransferase